MSAREPPDAGVPDAGGPDTPTDAPADGGDGSAQSAHAGPLRAGMRLQYQLVGALDLSVDVDVFVIDLFERSVAEVAELHARGRVVLAYISAGSHEPWRPDAGDFPDAALGRPLSGYPDERWLDVRDPQVRSLMSARIALASDKGFDGVLLAALDAYARDSGHALDANDQLAYNLDLADSAHAVGLIAGTSSAWDLATELAPRYDFAIHVGCLAAARCDELSPYQDAERPVFDLEVSGTAQEVCAESARLGLPITLKEEGFDAWLHACP